MNCPVCTAELRVLDRQGIEIDMCPKCRGVWLDRGELEKIIARSTSERYDDDDDSGEYRAPRRHDQQAPPPYQKGHPPKRESFWSRFFDDD